MFKIIDAFSHDGFTKISVSLYDLVRDDGYDPSLVIGVPSGGKYVVEAMSLSSDIDKVFIGRARFGTKVKRGLLIYKILPFLPMVIRNWLRVGEVWFREFIFRSWPLYSTAKEKIFVPLDSAKKIKQSQKILIVDDSIDSGATMRDVFDIVRKINPHADIKIATINTTFKTSMINPDYVLFRRVIVRFPWAMDVNEPPPRKNEKKRC